MLCKTATFRFVQFTSIGCFHVAVCDKRTVKVDVGMRILTNEFICSYNSLYRARLQGDGNLAVLDQVCMGVYFFSLRQR